MRCTFLQTTFNFGYESIMILQSSRQYISSYKLGTKHVLFCLLTQNIISESTKKPLEENVWPLHITYNMDCMKVRIEITIWYIMPEPQLTGQWKYHFIRELCDIWKMCSVDKLSFQHLSNKKRFLSFSTKQEVHEQDYV